MNWQEKGFQNKAPKWLGKKEWDEVSMTSEVSSWDSMSETTTSLTNTNQWLEAESRSRYVPETYESDEDIVQAHDDAWSTNQFIAEWLHEIASTANKIVILGEGDDIVREEVPDWHARLQAFKEISDHKWLRWRKEQKKKKREWSVYVFVP